MNVQMVWLIVCKIRSVSTPREAIVVLMSPVLDGTAEILAQSKFEPSSCGCGCGVLDDALKSLLFFL